MEITIGLTRADFERLLYRVPPEATGHTVLRRWAAGYGAENEKPLYLIVDCEQDEATALLEAAIQYYPAAAPEIEYGLRMSGAFDEG